MKTGGWTKLDKLGMTLSFLCAVHCLVMPILLPFIPLLAGSFLSCESLDSAMMYITLLIAAPTLFRGYLKHRKFRVPAVFLLSLLFFALRPETCLHFHDGFHLHDALHFVFAALAGFSLAVGHWLNLKLCKSCLVCSDSAQPCH